ncbi:alpha/beta hydrolase, partial [Leptospira venezuelensis]|uniref:alpha/beta hydrolase n=1 Tax=Leptospira venezuelensis TaxID=1958811 RepID=UPI003006A9DA
YLFRSVLYYGKSEKIDPKLIPGELITISNSNRDVNAHLLKGKDRSSKGLVVMLHGQGGTMYGEARFFKHFYEQGYSGLFVEYAGFGLSKKYSPSENNLYDDSEKIIRYVQAKYNFPPNKTILWGRSLGSGVAIELTLRNISSHLILVTPYTSIYEVAKYKYTQLIPEFLIIDKFENISKAASINLPTLIVAARLDNMTPINMALSLHAKIENSSYLELATADHFSVNENLSGKDFTKIFDFLTKK